MANSLGNGIFNAAAWSNDMQVIFVKESRAMAIANMDARASLDGIDTIHRPYRSHLTDQAYTKGTDITVQDISGTDESYTINTSRVVPFYIDMIDIIQNKYTTKDTFSKDAMNVLTNRIDQAIFAEYSNANNTVDDGSIGGTSGTAIALSQSNVMDIFAASSRKLNDADVNSADRFACVSPRFLETMQLSVGNRETLFGDKVGDNGVVGSRFGFNVIVSNNMPYTASLATGQQVSEGDTVVIAGVTFTFNATPSGAGSVDIGSDAATSTANLVAAINDTGTAGTTYIQLTDANRWKLTKNGIVATNNTTSIGIVGYGDIIVSETLTHASNIWSVQKQHLLFGIKGATDMTLQRAPLLRVVEAEKRIGYYVYAWMLYGKKTWTDMKDALVQITLDASSWV